MERYRIKMNREEKIESILKDLIQERNFESIPEVFSKLYVVHTSKKNYSGHLIIKKWVKKLYQFFVDIKIVNIQFLSSTEDKITWIRTLQGKIKPSKNKHFIVGKKIKWDEMIISRFKDNLIVEEWINSEFLGELHSKMKKNRTKI